MKSNNIDIDDIPSPDELKSQQVDVDSLPSPEELKGSSPKEDFTPVSKVESTKQGLVSGGTLGASPIISGAEGALFEKGAQLIGKGTESEKSLGDLYREYRDLQKQREQTAQKSNPKTFLASQLAGGIATGSLVPGLNPTTLKGATGLGAAVGGINSNVDLTKFGENPTDNSIELAKDIGVGAGLGLGGGLLAKGLTTATNPAELERAGSKMASNVLGIKPMKEVPRIFDQDTGRLIKQYNEVKGIGKNAIESGALEVSGNMGQTASKAQDIITDNFKQLKPIIQSTQEKIEQSPEAIQQAGPIIDKINDYSHDFFNNIEDTTRGEALRKKLEDFYLPRLQKINSLDGNLPALMTEKSKLYSDAISLTKNIYSNPDSFTAESEANFLKGLARVVKEHTQDLASTVDPQAGQQIQGLNNNISKMIDIQQAAEKEFNKSSPSGLSGTLSLPSKILTGKSPGDLLQTMGAKTAIGAANKLKTPTGQGVQSIAPAGARIIKQLGVNPESNKSVQDLTTPWTPQFESNPFSPIQEEKKASPTKDSSSLYNADPDQLKEIVAKLKTIPGIDTYGHLLEEGINSNNDQIKNRAIFLALQNPVSKRLIFGAKDVG